MARKKPDIEKISQNTIPASITASNPNDFPIVYGDDIWDVAISGSGLANLMGNIGQYDQHSINESLASGIGEATLGTAITATQTVGGITSGKNLPANTTFHDFVDMLVNPFVNPSVALTITPSGVREKGNAVTSITMTAEVTKGTANVAYIEFFREGVANPLHTITSGVTAGGTFTYTYEPADEITTNVSFRASVTDSAATQHTVDSAVKDITFAYFVYYGTSASTSVPTASGLSSKATSSTETPTFSTDAYIWYLTPTAKTTIQQNIMGTWNNIDTESIGQVEFTTSYGESVTYYAYRSTKLYASGVNMNIRII